MIGLLPGYNIKISMIGPYLNKEKDGKIDIYHDNKLSVSFHSCYYHELVVKNWQNVPDFAIAFNALCNQVTWEKTILYLEKRKIPFCFTSSDLVDQDLDCDVLGRNYKAKIMFRSINPFRSLRVLADPWTPNNIYSPSQYIFLR